MHRSVGSRSGMPAGSRPVFPAGPFPYDKRTAADEIYDRNRLGWGIDAATGALMKPEFRFYQIDFRPVGQPAESGR